MSSKKQFDALNSENNKRGSRWRSLFALTGAIFLTACASSGPKFIADEIIERQSVEAELEGETFDISYLVNGDPSGVRVIFVHGTPGNGAEQRSFLYNVPEGFEFVSVDRPGFGETKPNRAVTSLDAQAAALLPLLETRNGIKPILIGHSLGGPVVTAAAANYPEKIGGLIQVASALDPDLEDVWTLQHVGDWAVVSWALSSRLKHANRELIDLEDELRALQPKLANIKQPITIVHSTDDELVPYDNVPFMQREFSGSVDVKTVTLEDKNHFIPWNAAPTLMREVMALAEKLKSNEFAAQADDAQFSNINSSKSAE